MFLPDADAPSKRRTHFLRNIVDGVRDKRDQARELGLKGKALLRGSDGVGSGPSISSRGGVQRKGDDAPSARPRFEGRRSPIVVARTGTAER